MSAKADYAVRTREIRRTAPRVRPLSYSSSLSSAGMTVYRAMAQRARRAGFVYEGVDDSKNLAFSRIERVDATYEQNRHDFAVLYRILHEDDGTAPAEVVESIRQVVQEAAGFALVVHD